MNTILPNPEVPEVNTEVVETSSEVPEETIGTEQTETVKTEDVVHEGGEPIDYRQKFIDSAKGANQLLQEKRELERQLAEKNSQQVTTQELPKHSPDVTTTLYPGFEELDPEAQRDLIVYTDVVTRRAVEQITSNPAIAYAEKKYNEGKWEEAFSLTVAQFPDLLGAKDDFKADYFDPNNVPDNISDILEHMAKAFLFDKAQAIGVEEGKELAGRVQLDSPTGGDKTPTAQRSLDDWYKMSQDNPVKFATMKKEYEADLASGKLQE